MNIGSIKQNEGGIFVGKIETLTIAMTIALREVHSANPKAPKFEVLALSASRAWVQVGALFELFSNGTGEAFLNGKIEDPSLAAPLYISAFRQEDGSYNVVWSRPTRRRDLASEMARKADDALPPLPGEGETAGAPAQGAEAGLGHVGRARLWWRTARRRPASASSAYGRTGGGTRNRQLKSPRRARSRASRPGTIPAGSASFHAKRTLFLFGGGISRTY